MSLARAVFATGAPGTGKSTILGHLAEQFASEPQTGFVTRERRRDGVRAGFEIVVAGRAGAGLLASPDTPGPIRFGSIRADGTRRLGVDTTFLDGVACPLVAAALPGSRLVVIDEIGPMQSSSSRFRGLIEDVLASQAVLVASVALHDDPWIARFAQEASRTGHELRARFVDQDDIARSMIARIQMLLAR